MKHLYNIHTTFIQHQYNIDVTFMKTVEYLFNNRIKPSVQCENNSMIFTLIKMP